MHTNLSTNRARCAKFMIGCWTRGPTIGPLRPWTWARPSRALPPSALDDGRVLILGNASSNTYAFTAAGNSFQWSSPTSLKAYPNALVTPEGSCTLQQDGRVFCADSDSSAINPARVVPIPGRSCRRLLRFHRSPSMAQTTSRPVLQLYDGSMMVLGADSQTSSNAPPKDAHAAILGAGDTWRMAPPIRATQPNGTPPQGDTPSIVMSDGRVLVASDSDDAGLGNGGPSALHEFDPSAPGGGSWTAVPNPPSATFTTVGACIACWIYRAARCWSRNA